MMVGIAHLVTSNSEELVQHRLLHQLQVVSQQLKETDSKELLQVLRNGAARIQLTKQLFSDYICSKKQV